jgi:hypothetical protein
MPKVDQGAIDCDGPPAACSLRRLKRKAMPTRVLKRTFDTQRFLNLIQIAPTQSEHFPPTHSGERRNADDFMQG